ncbi:MAG: hypothetical protein ACLQL2_02320 [Methylovirgula sp.]
MTDIPHITLLPVGNPDRRALDDLARDLSGMGFVIELAGRRALPQGRSMPSAASSMPMPFSAWRFRSGPSACSPSPTSTSMPAI